MSTSSAITIDGADALSEVFRGLESSFDSADYSETFQSGAIPELLHSHRQNLDEQVDSEGNPWEPLSPTTIKKKRREGSPFPEHALWNWGSLRKSVLDTSDRYHIGGVNPRDMAFGSDAHSWDKSTQQWNPSAELMQFGGWTQIGGKTVYVPARPFIGVNRDVLDKITEQVADHAVSEFDFKV